MIQNNDSGYESTIHKSIEPFKKKYSWIKFQQVLALLIKICKIKGEWTGI